MVFVGVLSVFNEAGNDITRRLLVYSHRKEAENDRTLCLR